MDPDAEVLSCRRRRRGCRCGAAVPCCSPATRWCCSSPLRPLRRRGGVVAGATAGVPCRCRRVSTPRPDSPARRSAAALWSRRPRPTGAAPPGVPGAGRGAGHGVVDAVVVADECTGASLDGPHRPLSTLCRRGVPHPERLLRRQRSPPRVGAWVGDRHPGRRAASWP
ncbi:hypothetical protein QJS66_00880 [Kocuria rhizophila]|nr:hypothetical protein QJS66_00880 [Kocuria rhizophila]